MHDMSKSSDGRAQEMATGWEKEIRTRQEFRSQMVQSFGFTVMDHGVALAVCPECGALSSVNSAFPDCDWNSVPHLLSVIETYLEGQGTTIHCGSCKHGFQLHSGKGDEAEHPYWIWHSHYLSESKRDLQVLIYRKNGRTEWVEGMLVEPDGRIVPTPLPVSEQEFKAMAGCHFSVRQAWREFLKGEWPVSRFAAFQISDGYFLVVNPPVENDKDLSGFKENCVKLVAGSPSAGNHFEFADLSWADSWNFEENTYHQWLTEYEEDLEGSDTVTGVLASPDQFYAIVSAEVESFGCKLRRESAEAQQAFLGDDEYFVSFDFREYLVNAMIKGYSYWGALRYIEPIVDSWERSRETGERLKGLLKHYNCTVYGGRYFQARPKRAKKIAAEFDLLILEEPEDDIEDEQAFLEWLAPQIDLNIETRRFEPVKPGAHPD